MVKYVSVCLGLPELLTCFFFFAELCHHKLPYVSHATYKALTYKIGTLLNCDCKKGFRRISNRLPYMNCTGNSGHSSWENQCQCVSICKCFLL